MHLRSVVSSLLAMFTFVGAAAALAKLPPPSDEAKAKAAEAKAKADWTTKVAAYKTCQAENRAVQNYEAEAKKAGREVKKGPETPPCTDPGPFAAPAASEAAQKS
jgi:hypothetical protein